MQGKILSRKMMCTGQVYSLRSYGWQVVRLGFKARCVGL